MRTLKTNLLLIEEILSHAWQTVKINSELFVLIQGAYYLENKKQPCCASTLERFYNELTREYQSINPNYKNPLPMENQGKFKLKKGMMLEYPSENGIQHATPENLTDQSALATLKENPARIKCFSDYPKDWESLLKDSPEASTEAEAEVVQDKPIKKGVFKKK